MRTTALLLNWKRPDNVFQIIDCLRRQTVDIDIFLWNNNPEDTTDYPVDLKIDSSQNLFCWPRWLMASLAKTGYVFSMDDDLIFTQDNVIEECISYLKELPNDAMIGYCGVQLNKDLDYWQSNHIKTPDHEDNIAVDVVKGRFIFTRTVFMKNVPIFHKSRRGDDIAVSSYSKCKVIPSFLTGAIENLDMGDVGLDTQEYHKPLRTRITRYYFKGKI